MPQRLFLPGPRPWRECAQVVLACVIALLAATADAQLPRLPGGTGKPDTKAPAAPAETPEQARARLERQRVELRALRDRPIEAPAGISPKEIAELQEARATVASVADVQLRSLDKLAELRAVRAKAEQAGRDWQGFPTPPPFSILMIDELRDAADIARARIHAIESARTHLRTEDERFHDDTRRAEEAVRRAEDAVAAADAGAERERALWRRDLAQWWLRASGSRAAVTRLIGELQAEELATRRTELALLDRQIATAVGASEFTAADLAKAKARLAEATQGRQRELATLATQFAQRERERAEASAQLAQLRETGKATPTELAVAEARLRAADTWGEALRAAKEVLDGLNAGANDTAQAWESRRAAFVSTDAEARHAAAGKLRGEAARVARWQVYVEALLGSTQARLADAEAALARSDAEPAAARYDQDTVLALRRMLAVHERARDALARDVQTLDRWVGDIGKVGEARDFRTRAADAWVALKENARTVWNFELFAVEDSVTVDGQEVKTERGVTVGKSIGALLLFVLGYWAAARVARRLERSFVARGFEPRVVRNWRRWALTLVALLLALFTLNIARIPLTVFAFLGGALAIGVGFGTQTIIKNFISGLILLAERRIQIGDIVEVDGVTGTVTSLDLRSSTVLGFDGVETLVPNSVLLENKVTNWTQTDRRVRRVVKVGVAYGSPVRSVADLLEECAKRHGVVLDDPAPQVIFEDFGADALMFGLYFWVELGPKVSAAQIASDLRFMIEKRFAEAGIVVAYPQRDVHLDTAQPLRVEVVRRRADPPLPGA